MSKIPDHIHPVFDSILGRKDKQALLKQQSVVIWFTGLSGSGKTTIAIALEKELNKRGILTQVLDGDNIRAGINNNLGFSENDRKENIRRIAEVTKLFLNCGIVTINCFVSPTNEIREQAKTIIGENDFLEIFINTPIEICEQRDVKGLYKKARAGEIKDFTGISSPFEAPTNPFLDVKTANRTVEESVKEILDKVLTKIQPK
ncbi:MAG: adenylyl-sulfate kinase [Flavobacteriales bacterium]|nr:adenylyl-sulfate kinase [Flavobacteriales bacterium]MCB9174478.1 adenylyl-sulfate kinase [Flavobacteriales bacterium]